MTTMDTNNSEETVPKIPRNILILEKLKKAHEKKQLKIASEPTQDFKEKEESVKEKCHSETIPKAEEEVEKKFESTLSQNANHKDADEESDSKEKFKKLMKNRTAARTRTSSVSSSDIDCSQDSTVDLMRRSKLQEYLFKNCCDINPKHATQDHDSSSTCSDTNPNTEKSPNSSSISSSSRSNYRFRKQNYRFHDDEEDDECVPTEGLLHLKKPCIDEQNHSLYYDNHGRMEPIDWDAVVDKSKLSDDIKIKPKSSKNKMVMGPAEAFLTKDAHLLAPIPEFSNAVENSVDENTSLKVSDNVQRVKNTRDFSPLLKIERMVNKYHPESLKIPADVKKQLKSSNRKPLRSKSRLLDKTNFPNQIQENKTNTLSSKETENKSEIIAGTLTEFKPSETVDASAKKNEISVVESERTEICTQEDKESFQSEKPKHQANAAGNKKFHNQNKNKKWSDSSDSIPNEGKNNQGRSNKNKFPRKENSEINSKFEYNDARKNNVFADENRRKEGSNYKNNFERSKPHANFSATKKPDEFNKNKKRSISQLNKLRKMNALDSDDASSTSDASSENCVSNRFEAFRKIKQLNAKYLIKTSRDVCSEKPEITETTEIDATTSDVEEKEFLLKETCTRYFNKPLNLNKNENPTKEKEPLIKELKTKHFIEEIKNEPTDQSIEVLNEIKDSSKLSEKLKLIDTDITAVGSEENNVSTKNKEEMSVNILNQPCMSNETIEKRNDKKCTELITSETEDILEVQKAVGEINNFDNEETFENFELSSKLTEKLNANFNNETTTNTDSNTVVANNEEISIENDDVEIQTIVQKIYADLDIIDLTGEVFKKDIEKLELSSKLTEKLNKNFNNETATNTDNNAVVTNNEEISIEKDGVEIQTKAQKIYADLDMVDLTEEVFEKGIEKSDDQLNSTDDIKKNFVDCSNQSNSIESDDEKNKMYFDQEEKDKIQESKSCENSKLGKSEETKTNDKNIENNFSSEYNCNDENIEEIIICDVIENEKESSVVIEEISDDDEGNKENFTSTVSTEKSSDKIQSQSTYSGDFENKENSTSPRKSTNNVFQNYSSYDDNCMEIDGFECVNMDQFGPFASLLGTLRSLKESGKEISQDTKHPDMNMNEIAERNGLESIEGNFDVSTNKNHSGTDGSVSSNLESDEEIVSDSMESSKPAEAEDNIFSGVNVDEIYLDNCSLNQGSGDPYYGHLLIKEPKNNSKLPGRMTKMSKALKNYKNKIQDESAVSKESKNHSYILDEIKKRQLHRNCKPLPEKKSQ